MSRKKHTATEKAEILAQTLLKKKDIRVLYDCGGEKARELAEEFQNRFEKKYHQDIDCIPVSEFVELMNYPEARVLKYAKLGY